MSDDATPAEQLLHLLARTDGTLRFFRRGKMTIIRATARNFNVQEAFTDSEPSEEALRLRIEIIHRKLDQQIGG